MRACTIVARNYLAHARVLARSLRRVHPHGRLAVLVLDDHDGAVDASAEPFEVLHPRDLALEPAEFRRMATIYTVLELATALKPWLLGRLLDDGAPAALYLDPDIQVLAPLDGLDELIATHGIVLTPHTTAPVPRDGREPTEPYLLRAGAYNLGFLGVGPSARPFLDWWRPRLARDCVVAVEDGLFVDQRWADLVPGYFDHHILRDPGYNAAYWNLDQRDLQRVGDRVTVGGRPLRFLHFSGFDPDAPHLLSVHAGCAPRVLLSQRPVLRALCEGYAAALREAGYDEVRGVEYGFARSAAGLPIDQRMRRLYRRELLAREADGRELDDLPDPFDREGAERFVAWLNEPDPGSDRVSRYLAAIHASRPDVRSAHPHLEGIHAEGFLEWVLAHGRHEHDIPSVLLPTRAPRRRDQAPPQPQRGVNLAGYVRTENGVGEAARLLVAVLEEAGEPHAVVPVSTPVSRNRSPHPAGTDPQARFDVNLVCVNADEFERFATGPGADILEGRYTIGMWAWEVDRFPAWMAAAARHVDEIWVGSAHAARAVAPAVDVPVHTLPLPVVEPEPAAVTRADLGLPEGFLAVFCFDFESVFERKNPLGVIAAFRRAFRPDEGAHLVVKTVNGQRNLPQLERLRLAAADRDDISVVDGFLDRAWQHALLGACDVYISLHRAEGFGLLLAEAMALARPVIATGYSGNLEFMTSATSLLVPARLVAVGEGNDPYPPDARWADPDLDAAAALLRRVRDDPEWAAELGRQARQDVLERHGPAARVPFLRSRLEAARDGHSRAAGRQAAGAGGRGGGAGIRAAQRIAEGPDTASRSRYGPAARVLRGAVLRATRHLREHQQVVDTELLNAIREAQAEIDALSRELGALDGQAHRAVEELTGGLENLTMLREQLTQLSGQVAAIDDDLSAVPYTSDPAALLTTDDEGREAIGYRELSEADDYADFEDLFRGSEAFIRERLRVYVPLLEGRDAVVDLGCGRGEMLDLLAAAGVDALGVDVDPGMVERSRRKGHRVHAGDALAWLADQPAGALDAIFSAQFVEHLPPPEVARLLTLARRTLRPGGVLVAETVNPHSVRAFKTFWLDPTHTHPLFPETLVSMCRQAGFPEAIIRFPHGTGKLSDDRRTQGEYALVATVLERS